MLQNDSPPLGLELGLSHTLAINSKNQLYSWGVNAHGQCGVDTRGSEGKCRAISGVADVRFRQMACGDVHSLGLDYDGNLFVWGGNKQGQLGVGNCDNVKQPCKVANCAFSGDVKEVSAKGSLSIVVTNEGKAYMWPTKDALHQPLLAPIELPFTKLVTPPSP